MFQRYMQIWLLAWSISVCHVDYYCFVLTLNSHLLYPSVAPFPVLLEMAWHRDGHQSLTSTKDSLILT